MIPMTMREEDTSFDGHLFEESRHLTGHVVSQSEMAGKSNGVIE